MEALLDKRQFSSWSNRLRQRHKQNNKNQKKTKANRKKQTREKNGEKLSWKITMNLPSKSHLHIWKRRRWSLSRWCRLYRNFFCPVAGELRNLSHQLCNVARTAGSLARQGRMHHKAFLILALRRQK